MLNSLPEFISEGKASWGISFPFPGINPDLIAFIGHSAQICDNFPWANALRGFDIAQGYGALSMGSVII